METKKAEKTRWVEWAYLITCPTEITETVKREKEEKGTCPTHFMRFSSVQFSRSVVSNSLRPHELQHARPPCLSPTPRVNSDSRQSSW